MEKVGVIAVVEELAKFQGDMGKIDSAIAGIIPTSGLLGSTLSTLGDIASSVGGWIADVLAHAIGELLADAVEWAAQKLQELITAAIDAGNEFQALEIRLNQMNFNSAIDSGMEYNEAIKVSTEQTKEQLLWIQKLATVTPFELSDISKVYGMARSYGFANDETQDLVATLGDFTAGMGLSGDAMVSIIRQFGQMRNTGKILQKDLNALAEGGMVPVNKILDIMKEKTGLSGKAFDEFKTSAAGAEMFLATFTDYVKNNYTGAAENANRTLKNAAITLKEFFSSFAASNVVKPIMDIIGGRIADLNDQLQARLPDIISGFERIGTALSDIITEVLDLGPTAEDMAGMFVDGLGGIADWLATHKQDIVDFFKSGKDFIDNTLLPKLRELRDWFFGKEFRMQAGTEGFLDKIMKVFGKLSDWYDKNGNVITIFIQSIGDIIADVFDFDIGTEDPLQGFLDGLTKFMWTVSENKDTIAFFIELFLKIAIAVEIVSGVFSFLIGTVISLVGFFGGLYTIATLIGSALTWLGGVMGVLAGAISAPVLAVAALVAGIIWAASMVYYHGDEMMTTIEQIWFLVKYYAGQLWTTISEAFTKIWGSVVQSLSMIWQSIVTYFTTIWSYIANWASSVWQTFVSWGHNVWNAIASINWYGLGTSMVQGMINGIWGMMGSLIDAAWNVAINAYHAAQSALMSHSPSRLFENLGKDTVRGFVEGIDKAAAGAAGAMQGMVSGVVSVAAMTPALASAAAPSTVNNTTNNNYNLNINSSARTEPIIQDFNLLASLQAR